jgi:hypothetical protein
METLKTKKVSMVLQFFNEGLDLCSIGFVRYVLTNVRVIIGQVGAQRSKTPEKWAVPSEVFFL